MYEVQGTLTCPPTPPHPNPKTKSNTQKRSKTHVQFSSRRQKHQQHSQNMLFFFVFTVFFANALQHFAWQAWHLVTSTFVLRGRRGAWSHPPSFCVTGVALMALGGPLGSVLVAGDAAALCVAGVALGHIYLRFAWQA